LNWIGISESAKVSLVGAIVAFISDLAILFTVFTHISFSEFLSLFPKMFSSQTLTAASLLAGFAGSFLAFSGLESISQLSPVMKEPRKKVASIALFLVVLTVGITSPLLTMFSTILLPDAASNSVASGQLISLLAGRWGGQFLQTEVAISASALLVFASNTAIIGAYHVFIALSRMEFLPDFILRRNKLRGTPHYSIALATIIPIIVLLAVNGNINTLGDMYAFGLLGAFTLTCLGLDIVRLRDWKKSRQTSSNTQHQSSYLSHLTDDHQQSTVTSAQDYVRAKGQTSARTKQVASSTDIKPKSFWFKVDFCLGVLTTMLVALAWSTNLITKPLATGFGGGVALLGMIIAYVNYAQYKKQGKVPVPIVVTRIEERLPDSILAILMPGNPRNDAVIKAAVSHTEDNKPIMFLYISERKPRPEAPRMMEIIDPYLDDTAAKELFGKAEGLALKAKIPLRRFVYLQGGTDLVPQVWQLVHPYDTIVAAEDNERFQNINPDRIRYELTTEGKVAHLLKRWDNQDALAS